MRKLSKLLPASESLFGRRMREARSRMGLAQDKLGVLIGLDESCSSARISRYETGVHEPPFETAKNIALALNVPVAYFYCDRNDIAELLIIAYRMPSEELQALMVLFKKI